MKLKVIRLLVLTAALMLLVGCGGISESDIEATVEARVKMAESEPKLTEAEAIGVVKARWYLSDDEHRYLCARSARSPDRTGKTQWYAKYNSADRAWDVGVSDRKSLYRWTVYDRTQAVIPIGTSVMQTGC